MNLHKFVTLLPSGTWVGMFNAASGAIAETPPGGCVEEWSYPLKPDGTHGRPYKRTAWTARTGRVLNGKWQAPATE